MWDQGVMSATGGLYANIFMDGPRQHGGMGNLWQGVWVLGLTVGVTVTDMGARCQCDMRGGMQPACFGWFEGGMLTKEGGSRGQQRTVTKPW